MAKGLKNMGRLAAGVLGLGLGLWTPETGQAREKAPPPPCAQVIAARESRLDTLAPSPESRAPTTAMVRMRTAPSNGERERMRDVAVVSQCGDDFCIDGLRDVRTGRDLIALKLTKDERQILAAPGTLQRVVKLAHVGERYVSVYTGYSEFSGGAHSNNHLACETYDRRTGRTVRLAAVVPAKQLPSLLQRAKRRLRAFERTRGAHDHTLHPANFLYDEDTRRITLCTEAPFPSAGTLIELTLGQGWDTCVEDEE